MKKGIVMLLLLALYCVNYSNAQDNKPSKTQFMVRGYGHSGLDFVNVNGDAESSYVGTAFAPIFMFKHSDKLMFESELEFALEDGKVQVGFEYADVMYIVNDYVTVRAGKFLLPFGTFMEKLHPAWINRLATKPLGFGHGGIAPASGIGLEVRGAFNIGYSKLNYSVYSTNGPRLNLGVDEPEEAGQLIFNNFEDNNNNKAVGGRVGLLPFNNSSVEIGGSFYTGIAGNEEDSLYGNVGAALFAGDFSFVKQVPFLKGIIDVKAQFTQSNVGKANYYELEPGDSIPTKYTFNNQSQAFYAQLSYRPSMLDVKVLKDLEFVGRYSTLNTPEGSVWESQQTQVAIGINYWLTWRSVLKFSYQVTDIVGGHDAVPGESTKITGMYAHWALGF